MANHIRKQIRSMRGEPIDFSALSQNNAGQRALGNAGMNAKGDRIGIGGVVLKTQEQIEAEWAAQQVRTTTTASIKSDTLTTAPSPDPVAATPPPSLADPAAFPSIEDLLSSGAITPPPPRKKAGSNE